MLETCEVIKDRMYHMKTYPCTFIGCEFVDWLLEQGDVDTRESGVILSQVGG